jgi:uncharacterized membrane protein YeaQ/YmgE (transglycosylase-associated protein family)
MPQTGDVIYGSVAGGSVTASQTIAASATSQRPIPFSGPGRRVNVDHQASKEADVNVIWWLIVGIVAGLIARLVVPGRDPMGAFGTLLLGLVGSLVGGFIGDALTAGDQDFSPAGILGSIVGAVIALLLYRAATNRRRGAAY